MVIENIILWIRTAKPEWLKPRIPDKQEKKLLVDIVQEEFDELKKAILNDDLQEILDAVVDITWTALNSAVSYGISEKDIINMYNKVNDSNFSKFCASESEAIKTVEAYSRGTHPDKLGKKIETYYEKLGNFYIVFRKSDKKILKSVYYRRV